MLELEPTILEQVAESARREGEAAREAWRCRICLSADVDAVLVRPRHESTPVIFVTHGNKCIRATCHQSLMPVAVHPLVEPPLLLGCFSIKHSYFMQPNPIRITGLEVRV